MSSDSSLKVEDVGNGKKSDNKKSSKGSLKMHSSKKTTEKQVEDDPIKSQVDEPDENDASKKIDTSHYENIMNIFNKITGRFDLQTNAIIHKHTQEIREYVAKLDGKSGKSSVSRESALKSVAYIEDAVSKVLEGFVGFDLKKLTSFVGTVEALRNAS